MTDEERLREIRERCEAATPGPWTTGWDWDKPRPDECSLLSLKHGHICKMSCGASYHPERVFADARFIRYARGDVPWLLDLLARAEGLTDEEAERLSTMACAKVVDYGAECRALEKRLERAETALERIDASVGDLNEWDVGGDVAALLYDIDDALNSWREGRGDD